MLRREPSAGFPVVLLALLAPACGDPVLPSDFAGPPAAEIAGNVVVGDGEIRDAARPRLSLQWLTSSAVEAEAPLFGQPLRYRRSRQLATDWDIGLALPTGAAKLDMVVGGRPLRLGVAKIVYFDDRVPDDRLDWSCRAPVCDEIKAVSAQFVVFVESLGGCTLEPQEARPRLGPGYHYFRLDRGIPVEMERQEALHFTLSERPLTEGDPTADLRLFLQSLVRAYALSGLDGC